MLKCSHKVRWIELHIILGVGRGRGMGKGRGGEGRGRGWQTPTQPGSKKVKHPKTFATDCTSSIWLINP